MSQLPILCQQLIKFRLALLLMLRHLHTNTKHMSTQHVRGTHLGSNIIRLHPQLLHLVVVILSLQRHLLVLPLQPLDGLLGRESFVLCVFLCAFEFVLGVLELFVDALRGWLVQF
jgi:hypothetical protein